MASSPSSSSQLPKPSAPSRTVDLQSPNPPAKQAGLLDALSTIRLSDFTTFHQAPCARESLLTGIGAGAAIGGLRFIVLWQRPGPSTSGTTSSTTAVPEPRAAKTVERTSTPAKTISRRPPPAPSIAANLTLSSRIWRSSTWAVLSFTVVSAAAHIFCQRKRAMERAAMAKAAEIVARKREEKRIEALRRRDEREAKRKEHEEEKAGRSRWGRWFGSGVSKSGGAT